MTKQLPTKELLKQYNNNTIILRRITYPDLLKKVEFNQKYYEANKDKLPLDTFSKIE